ncbi:hypothetical protein [Streptomyces bacillaris]|uniref:hypothetical protein n=1 Tax=Streptomyces bacillaris TaxID=68179 RepID=UPI0038207CA9
MYRVLFVEFKTGTLWGELPASSLDFSRVLNAPGKATVTVPLANDPLRGHDWSVISPWRLLIYVQRGQRIVFGGPLITWSVDLEREEMVLNCEGLWSYYRRRLINDLSGRWNPQSWTREGAAYVGWDQADIVYDLLRTQADRSYDTGGTDKVERGTGPDALVFDWQGEQEPDPDGKVVKPLPGKGVMPPTGVARTRNYPWYEYKAVGEAVEQLAAVQRGFNFRIDHYWNGDRLVNHFRLMYPTSGEVTGLELEHGSNCEVTEVRGDGTNLVTQARATGAGEGLNTLIAHRADAEAEQPITSRTPRLETVESHVDVTEVATLNGYVERMLREGSKQVVIPSVRLRPDAFPGPDNVQVGQVIGLRVGTPWWPGNQGGEIRGERGAYLIAEIDTKVDGGGEETSLTLVPADLFEGD